MASQRILHRAVMTLPQCGHGKASLQVVLGCILFLDLPATVHQCSLGSERSKKVMFPNTVHSCPMVKKILKVKDDNHNANVSYFCPPQQALANLH